MTNFDSTAWAVIKAAATGDAEAREAFVAQYEPGIRTLLRKRWMNSAHHEYIDDAAQDVLLECFKHGGILEKAEQRETNNFRVFLKTVIRHVAGRYEQRWQQRRERHRSGALDEAEHAAQQTAASRILDREWAREVLRTAAAEQKRRAHEVGAAARMRVDILRLRFEDRKPIREIAAELELNPSYVHHQFAKAKQDFHRALLHVLRSRRPDAEDAELEEECRRLIDLLR